MLHLTETTTSSLGPGSLLTSGPWHKVGFIAREVTKGWGQVRFGGVTALFPAPDTVSLRFVAEVVLIPNFIGISGVHRKWSVSEGGRGVIGRRPRSVMTPHVRLIGCRRVPNPPARTPALPAHSYPLSYTAQGATRKTIEINSILTSVNWIFYLIGAWCLNSNAAGFRQ